MINAKIVCDSLASSGFRLTTFVLTYPRFIHAELMTHRMLSRNASSSRAIPVTKQIQEVIDNPAIPLAFRKNQKGMQAGDLLDDQDAAVAVWLAARDAAVMQARAMVAMDIHKQYANRILEPFAHITVICSATDWANFFALRIHPAAQPEICELATQMYREYKASSPEFRSDGEWHLPLVSKEEMEECSAQFGVTCLRDSKEALQLAIKRSVAKCARVSYKNHDGTKNTIKQDLELYDKLLGNVPIHASPAEHQAEADYNPIVRSGNFRGWHQYRKSIENENVYEYNGTDEGQLLPIAGEKGK